jgi:hypothetical protein
LFGVFGFLAWLAFDVFKVTTGFPLVLALIGVAIIILTVWLQKRFPELLRRMGGDPSQPARLPGGVTILLAPALLGFLLMGDAARIDREQAADRRSHSRATVWRSRRNAPRAGQRMRPPPQAEPAKPTPR